MILSLASCGNYEMATPLTSSQQVSTLKGYPALTGKPALKVPARIGVLTTRRTESIDFSEAATQLGQNGHIRSMQPINAFLPGGDYDQLSDVLHKRAKLIHDSRFLGLDVILVCDQNTESDSSPSILGLATLGMLDVGMRKQNTQLTVVCIDARTGYVYGAMGREENGRTPRLALFQEDALGSPKRSHLVRTSRREAVEGFPTFWNDLVANYASRR